MTERGQKGIDEKQANWTADLEPLTELDCFAPDYQKAREIINRVVPYGSGVLPQDAARILRDYHAPFPLTGNTNSITGIRNEDSTLSSLEEAYAYWALSTLSIQGMENRTHKGDPIRDDRSQGQGIRKKRTGSRRG